MRSNVLFTFVMVWMDILFFFPYPPTSCNSIWGKELACASMETAVWERIWVRAKVVISVATSTSEMRDSAFWRFSACMVMLVTVVSSRFRAAPRWERVRFSMTFVLFLANDSGKRAGLPCAFGIAPSVYARFAASKNVGGINEMPLTGWFVKNVLRRNSRAFVMEHIHVPSRRRHHVASGTRSGRSFGADVSSRCRQSGLDTFITKPL